MKIYRTNNDTSLRMQCVNIAKQIKQLKKQQIINRQLTDNNSNKISCIEV